MHNIRERTPRIIVHDNPDPVFNNLNTVTFDNIFMFARKHNLYFSFNVGQRLRLTIRGDYFDRIHFILAWRISLVDLAIWAFSYQLLKGQTSVYWFYDLTSHFITVHRNIRYLTLCQNYVSMIKNNECSKNNDEMSFPLILIFWQFILWKCFKVYL